MMTGTRNARYLMGLLCFLLTALPGTGCKSAGRPEASEEDAAVPPDFAVTCGKGGGFAGRWDGYTIDRDGMVHAWAGAVPGDEASPVGQLTAAQRAALWRDVQTTRYFELERRETGNMTAFLDIQAEGRTHRTSWVMRAQDDAENGTPLERLYAACRRVARQVAEEE